MILATELSTEFLEQLVRAHANCLETGKCGCCGELDCYWLRLAAGGLKARYTLPSRDVVANEIQAASLRETSPPGGQRPFMVHRQPSREQPDYVLDRLQDRLSGRGSSLARTS